MKHALFSLAVLCGMAASTARADILVTYDFTGQNGSQASQSATTIAPNVVASNMTRGAGVVAGVGPSDSMHANGIDASPILNTANNDYFSFVVTKTNNNLMNIDSLEFSAQRNGQGARRIQVRSSLDGFASSLGTFQLALDAVTYRFTATLGAAFDNVAKNSPIEFRLYGYNAPGSPPNGLSLGTGATPNLVLNGVLGVPEPATMGVFGLFSLVSGTTIAIRRRRKLASKIA